jgi:hypothetical protein
MLKVAAVRTSASSHLHRYHHTMLTGVGNRLYHLVPLRLYQTRDREDHSVPRLPEHYHHDLRTLPTVGHLRAVALIRVVEVGIVVVVVVVAAVVVVDEANK